MEYSPLGDTGLDVSLLSLGAGGHSQLGVERGKSPDQAVDLVRTALDQGINLIDTAEAYDTEEVVGAAIADVPREEVIVSTKLSMYADDELRDPAHVESALQGSLDRLGTSYVDIYHLHGVRMRDYEYAVEELYPELERLRDRGSIRHIGITEATGSDSPHEMLERAVEDDYWDVLMVGFNLLNHSARERVLAPATARGIGTIGMVAVRRALSDPDRLEEVIDELIATGEVDPARIDREDPFGFLVHSEGATDRIDAAYRFAAHEPTLDTVLSGTSSPDHLRSNVTSVERGPLPRADLELLADRFGDVDSVSGN